jgi:hypothetical protein
MERFEANRGKSPDEAGMYWSGGPVEVAPRTHTAIFTHGHLDHAFGLKSFLMPDQPRPRIVAQRAILDRFARYERTAGLNAGISARQLARAPGDMLNVFRRPALMPDLLFDERVVLSAGELTFEVSHCRGETEMPAGSGARSDGWYAPVISSSTRCPMPAIRRRCSAILGTGQTACAR